MKRRVPLEKNIIPHYGTASNNANDEDKLFRKWGDVKGEPLAGLRQKLIHNLALNGALLGYNGRRNYVFFTFELVWFRLSDIC